MHLARFTENEVVSLHVHSLYQDKTLVRAGGQLGEGEQREREREREREGEKKGRESRAK